MTNNQVPKYDREIRGKITDLLIENRYEKHQADTKLAHKEALQYYLTPDQFIAH